MLIHTHLEDTPKFVHILHFSMRHLTWKNTQAMKFRSPLQTSLLQKHCHKSKFIYQAKLHILFENENMQTKTSKAVGIKLSQGGHENSEQVFVLIGKPRVIYLLINRN